jgi:hypothetical protein
MRNLKKRFAVEDLIRKNAKDEGEYLTNADVIERADEFISGVRGLELKAASEVSAALRKKRKIKI